MSVGRSSLESARVRSFLVEAEAMFRDARTAAIEKQSQTAVIIDSKGRQLSFPDGGRTLDLPRAYQSMLKPAFVFDGRAVLPAAALAEHGFEAFVIGKGS